MTERLRRLDHTVSLPPQRLGCRGERPTDCCCCDSGCDGCCERARLLTIEIEIEWLGPCVSSEGGVRHRLQI